MNLKNSRSLSRNIAEILIEYSLEPIIALNSNGVILSESNEACRLLGYSRDEITHHSVTEIVKKTDHKTFLGVLAIAKSSTHSRVDNITFIKKDGSQLHISVDLRAVCKEDGDFEYSVCFLKGITKYIEAIENLNNSEESLTSLIDGIVDVVIVHDMDGNIIECNRIACEVFGYSKDEMLKLNVSNIDSSEFKTDFKIRLNHQIKNKIHRIEGVHVTRDGRCIPVDINTALITYKGKPAVIGVSRDITERKRMEEALQEALSRFEAVINNTPIVAIQAFNNEGIIQSWNDACTKIYGFSPSEAIGKRVQDILLPDQEKIEFEEAIKKIMDTGRATVSQEWLIKNKDNEERWVYSTMFPILKYGLVDEIFCMDVDITEHKRVLELLRSNEKFLQGVFDGIQDSIGILDRDMRIVRVNNTMEQWYLRRLPLVGRKCFEAYYGSSKPCENCPAVKVFELGTMQKNVQLMTQVSGDIQRWAEVFAYPLFDESGSVSGIVEYVRDITERKKMEEKLMQIATHDSLTGLFSRSFFEEQMELLSKERDVKNGVLILDVDGLKFVNDTLGHQEGDKLLIELSNILKKSLRPSDVIARIGGDEFAILLRNVDEEIISTIVDRFKTDVETYNQTLKSYQNPINISVGYAVKGSGLETMEQVFKQADDNLFKEKIPKREYVKKSILNVIKATIFEKDHITEAHMERLKILAGKFGDVLNLSAEERKDVILTTELHDIGKVAIPDEILNKRGRLTEHEFEFVKKHPEAGYRIAKATPEIAHIADYILCLHERWDGNGYPNGLKGEEIPFISRMVYILGSYYAMTNDRPYKKAMSLQEAINKLRDNAGTQFDPNLVPIFINEVLMNAPYNWMTT